MSNIRFVWDQRKADSNQRKHSISFEEAKTVFHDENAQLIADPDHSGEEDRFVLLGRSIHLRLLVVCHCYRESDSVIRIILARKASKRESKLYPGRLMRKEYDFSHAVRNPYAAKLKKQITIRLDEAIVSYFKKLADEFDIPYQNLINLYLRECALEEKRPKFQWRSGVEQSAGFDAAPRRKSA